MQPKSHLCKHSNSCLINSCKGLVKGAFIAISFRIVINFLKVALKLFRNPSNLLKFSKADLRFGLFLSFMISIQRFALCFLRRYTNNEKISSFISGFLSGIPLAFESSQNRVFYSLYLLTRAMETLLKSFVSQKKLPYIPYAYEALYSISFSFLVFTRVWNTECLSPSFYSFTNKLFPFKLDYVQINMTGVGDKIV